MENGEDGNWYIVYCDDAEYVCINADPDDDGTDTDDLFGIEENEDLPFD